VLTQVLLQTIFVAIIVLACVAYSSWTLMPATWRRALANQLIRRHVLARSSVLMRAAKPALASACGGCDSCGSENASNTKTLTPNESVIHFMPRKTQ
jgi:hypothetical protein